MPMAVSPYSPPSTSPRRITPKGSPDGRTAPRMTQDSNRPTAIAPARPARVPGMLATRVASVGSSGLTGSLVEAVDLGVGGPVRRGVVEREVPAALAGDPRALHAVEVGRSVRVPIRERDVDLWVESVRPAGPGTPLA